MKISVSNRQRVLRVDAKRVKDLVRIVLRGQSPDTELAIRFVGDQAIARCNKQFLNHAGPTDVISFPMGGKLLGDVMVSTERAVEQHKRYRRTVGEEACLYVVHGILHLLGYDDHCIKDRRRMHAKQRALLARAKREFGKGFCDKAIGTRRWA